MQEKTFTRYDVFIIAILTILQFTIILDFVVLSPLGYILMPELGITPAQFAMVVSAYAFSAGASGLLAAGFADRFDRKKMLLFFYTGFIIGTALCAFAPTYELLLVARIVTGLFGGVIGSITFAIITDLFRMEVRGRVMGFVQMAFASTQALGMPLGLYLAQHWDWHVPFFMIVALSVIAGLLILVHMKPVNAHLHLRSQKNALQHLGATIANSRHLQGFAATMLLATGGYMLMPFGSDYSVNNLGIAPKDVPFLYLVTGVVSIFFGPVIGKLSDTLGKYRVFVAGSVLTAVIVVIYCNLGVTPFWTLTFISILMFAGVSSRMISSSALLSGVPAPADRGAFMAINSSIQQLSGGLATLLAGLIVVRGSDDVLQNYDILGYVVVAAMAITLLMMYRIHRMVILDSRRSSADAAAPKPVAKPA